MATAAKSASAVDHFFTTMGRFELLDQAATIELSRKVQAWQQHEAGPVNCSPIIKRIGLAARDKLVRHNLRLVIKIWRDNYSSRIPTGDAGLADLLQLGAAALIRGAELYDATKGHRFSTYAATWIHKGMKDYLANEERLVRMPSNNYFTTKAAMVMQANRAAAGLPKLTTEEICEELGKTRRTAPTPKALEAWIHAYNTTNAVSFSQTVKSSNGDTELGDLIADTKIEELEEESTDQRAIKALSYLTRFERDVLERRYMRLRGGQGYRRIAKALQSTEEDVRQAEERAFKRIRLFASR